MKIFTNPVNIISLLVGIIISFITPKVSYAYPVFAQQAYESPREATGRIVCANCHLAQKPVDIKFLRQFYQTQFLKL
jgi:apocytochrome f